MPNPTRRALPWATAAGAIALVAGTIAGVPGAVAATTTPAANAFGIPAVAPEALSTTGDSIATPVAKSAQGRQGGQGLAKAPAAPIAVAKPAKAVKASAPTASGAKYSYFDTDFILRLRAAAVEPEVDIPHPLVPGVGYSAVNLEKDTGGPVAKCEIFGAGYYATDVVQEGVLENSGPPDAGNKGGGIFNPTESKDTAPNLSPGREPELPQAARQGRHRRPHDLRGAPQRQRRPLGSQVRRRRGRHGLRRTSTSPACTRPAARPSARSTRRPASTSASPAPTSPASPPASRLRLLGR